MHRLTCMKALASYRHGALVRPYLPAPWQRPDLRLEPPRPAVLPGAQPVLLGCDDGHPSLYATRLMSCVSQCLSSLSFSCISFVCCAPPSVNYRSHSPLSDSFPTQSPRS